jgi:hypothetical protein
MAFDPVEVNAPVERALAPDSVDLTTIDLTAGTTYRFIVEGADHCAGTLPDPIVGVFSGDLSQLLTAQDDSPNSLDPVLDFTPSVSGSYIVGVADFNGGGGTYNMAVFTVDPDPHTGYVLNFGDVKSG